MTRLRPLLVFCAGSSVIVFAAALALCTTPLMLVDRRRRIASAILRFYGRTTLWVCGVRLHVEGEERLRRPGGAILMPNHSSTLDTFVFTALLPSGASALAKHEFKFYPVIGQGAWLCGLLFIRRGNSERARATIQKAAARIRREELKVLVAPEGTRSKDGKLGPFKTGALRMALQAGVPVIPIAVHGAHEVHPYGRLTPHRGAVHVRVLDPIDVSDVDPEDLQTESDRLRGLLVAELEQMRKDHPDGGRIPAPARAPEV